MKRIALVLLSLVVALLVGSAGAYFTSQAQVPDNIVRAGGVTVSTEPTSAALSVDGMAPGVTATRSLAIVNNGSLPASLTITAVKKAGMTAFWDALDVRATSEGRLLYEGGMGPMRTESLTLAPAGRTVVDFAIGLPLTAGNEIAADYAKFTLYVDAEQVK